MCSGTHTLMRSAAHKGSIIFRKEEFNVTV